MTRRLLVLDDDATIGSMLAMVAETAGFDAHATTDPDEFFKLLEEKTPSHIALDLVMPQMDGVEVMRHLADMECAACIIITSGVGNRVLDAARRSAAEHGLNIIGALPKPFRPAAFRELLARDEPVAPRARQSDLQELAPPTHSESGLGPADLEHALAEDQIFLAYQPQVNCRSGAVTGFEALVRWRHPRLGVVMPDRFIPLAERSGQIGALTDRVVDLGLAWIAESFPATNGDDGTTGRDRAEITLSVNISAASLENRDFVQDLLAACVRHQVPTDRIVLELTETTSMRDPVATLDQLTRLRMKGFQLSIDDFGTGFSSMIQLARLPFSEIKIDKSFVMTAMQSMESRAVVRSVIELGKSFGLRTVAEGVEDANALDYIRGRGCDIAQGYHIARPMAGEDVAGWLESRPAGAGQTPHGDGGDATDLGVPSFKWDEEFVTGLDKVDSQHRRLVDLLNGFARALSQQESIEASQLDTLFSELSDYAKYHFAEEENLMQQVGLDERFIRFHRGEHAYFVTELMDLRDTVDSERPESLEPLLAFLIHWLAYHILSIDKSMARQVAAIREGVRPAEAAEREGPGSGRNREPMVAALVSLFGLLSQRNRNWRRTNRALEERAREQSDALTQARHKLENIEMTDSLTGLPNRRRAFWSLERHWGSSHIDSPALACLMLDVDNLKPVNAAGGHDAGDRVLCAVAECLQDTAHPKDIVCRLGGDEFLIVMPTADLAAAEGLANEILRKVAGLRVAPGGNLWTPGVSIGVATRSAAMSKPDDLVAAAQAAMFRAKDAGRNRVVSAPPPDAD